jgi:hypothetical protein
MAWLPEEDETWLRDYIASQRWIFAKTFADTAPHEYIVRRRNGVDPDWFRMQNLITDFGHMQNYFRVPRPYLILDGWKYWHIEPIINRAKPPETTYGNQWVPDTRSNRLATWYDRHAHEYDTLELVTKEEKAAVAELLKVAVKGGVLDVGCGTGMLLDLHPVKPIDYLGLDPSGGMLNVHVLKHHRHQVLPYMLGEAGPRLRPWHTVAALFGSASHLTPREIGIADRLADGFLLLMFFDSPRIDDRDTYAAARSIADVHFVRYGRFRAVFRQS